MKLERSRSLSRERLSEAGQLLTYITTIEPKGVDSTAPHVKMIRGLFYVQLYGVIEKTINESVIEVLSKVQSFSPTCNSISTPFLTVALSRKIKSLKDSGYDKIFEKSSDIFYSQITTDVAEFDDTIFSNFLQNIWADTISVLMKSLGISDFVIDAKLRTLLNEIVDKRNAVAHGRESALIIGESFKSDILLKKFTRVGEFLDEYFERLESFLTKQEFLQNKAA